MWIRYNMVSLLEVYRSTVPFTTPPNTGFADAEVSDGSVSGPVGQCRINASLTAVAADPALAPAPIPNIAGFIMALRAVVFPDPIRRNMVMRGYPEMMPAIQMGDWPTVSSLVQDSISTTPTGLAITSTEHAALQAAWTANSIPGTCP